MANVTRTGTGPAYTLTTQLPNGGRERPGTVIRQGVAYGDGYDDGYAAGLLAGQAAGYAAGYLDGFADGALPASAPVVLVPVAATSVTGTFPLLRDHVAGALARLPGLYTDT